MERLEVRKKESQGAIAEDEPSLNDPPLLIAMLCSPSPTPKTSSSTASPRAVALASPNDFPNGVSDLADCALSSAPSNGVRETCDRAEGAGEAARG
jgi:hypothetical protein